VKSGAGSENLVELERWCGLLQQQYATTVAACHFLWGSYYYNGEGGLGGREEVTSCRRGGFQV